MTDIDTPYFSSKDEEISYWKSLAEEYKIDAERSRREYEEFLSESKQLEQEYEAMIDQNEKKIKEISLQYNRSQSEIDALRIKLDISYKESGNYQTELSAIKSDKQQMQLRIRDLEQKNDDLERARRIVEESVAGFEQALNFALEKNAILESEIDEKETLKEKLQRLADETRDLKQELLVREKEKVPDNERILNGSFKCPPTAVDSNRLKENETQTSPVKREYQAPLSPASRVMALNIVSDLIRKVGGLERRLDYRELPNTELRRSRITSRNSPAPNANGITK
ncbi:nuclear distribution protein nudE-like 1-A isoform X2 [Cylas formicarius]|uniref:nuclear distribution protein nudE-like 1-A isoform X2 n=1 Tax=Cylas formicarius TaxID=197179 RepID=UPI0029588235|nr:nuclear distribution protein nudE-like 1-A isoform X2 [Cylas formicarius]